MESHLFSIEEGNGTGKVLLYDFYAAYVHKGILNFNERPEYLRQLGVLDESDPSRVRVLIPNYVHTPANCLESSSLYNTCCTDSCGDLFGHLEAHLQAPHASPERILSSLSETSSPHSPANRSWSRTLVSKLEEVAAHHGGEVPLHGRLFAQWLHFAYPRECMYPHVSNSVSTWTAEQWIEETGVEAWMSLEEMQDHVGSGAPVSMTQQPRDEEEEEVCLDMWMPEEELVDPDHGRVSPRTTRVQEGHRSLPRRLLFAGFFAALVISSISIMRGHVQQAAAVFCQIAPEDKASSKAGATYFV